MKYLQFRSFCLLLIALLAYSNLHAATLTSKVNRNQVGINETLILMVSYDDQVNSNQFDTSELEQDFDIVTMTPQSNSSVAMVNGSVTVQAKTAWNITLAPKRTGQLRIPSFEIGNATSQAIRINVSAAKAGNANQPQALTANIITDKQKVHIGEQILVKIELSSRDNVGSLNGAPLELTGADVEVLEQQQEQRLENGIARQVITISYAVFPNKSGTLLIPAQTYSGIEGNSRSVFSTLARRGKRIVARTEPVSIEVNPAQALANSAWFPAEHVSIDAKWSRDISNISVGEPVTRTVTIVAKGQRANIIPPLPVINSSDLNYKTYQDQPQLDAQQSPTGILSARVESQAIVPAIQGRLSLPEQKIMWWNTEMDEWQQATLPAETLMVAAGQATEGTMPIDSTTVSSETGSQQTQVITAQPTAPLWKILTAVFALISLVLSYFVWRLSNGSKKPVELIKQTNSLDEGPAWNTLKKALASGNAAETRLHLIEWARCIAQDRPRLSLNEIVDLAESNSLKRELSAFIHSLDAQLYRPSEDSSSSLTKDEYQQFAGVLKKLKQENKNRQTQQTSTDYTLKPLYPA